MGGILIGLCGEGGCGKSVISKTLMEEFGFKLIKQADVLKAMLRTFYEFIDIPEEAIDARIEGYLKDAPDPYLKGQTPRHAMQTLGTEWGRDQLYQDIWMGIWKRRTSAAMSAGFSVVCDDIRFHNEAFELHQKGGVLYRVNRPHHKQVAADFGTHPSEMPAGLPYDELLVNEGSLEDLRDLARDLVND